MTPLYLGEHEGETMPVGVHNVTITGKEFKNSQNGNMMAIIEFTNAESHRIEERYVLTEKALWRLANLAKAVGMTKQERDAFDVMSARCYDTLIGRSLTIQVVEERNPDNGKTYNKVSAVQPLQGKAPGQIGGNTTASQQSSTQSSSQPRPMPFAHQSTGNIQTAASQSTEEPVDQLPF